MLWKDASFTTAITWSTIIWHRTGERSCWGKCYKYMLLAKYGLHANKTLQCCGSNAYQALILDNDQDFFAIHLKIHNKVTTFTIHPQHWYGETSLNHSPSKTRASLFGTVSTLTIDTWATQGCIDLYFFEYSGFNKWRACKTVYYWEMKTEKISAISFTVHILLLPTVFCRFLNRNWFKWIYGLVVHVCSTISKELDSKPVEIGNNCTQLAAGR